MPSASASQGNAGMPEPVASSVYELAGHPAGGGEQWHPISVVTSVYGVYRQGGHVKLVLGVRAESKKKLPPKYQGELSEALRRVHFKAGDPSSLAATGLTLIDPRTQQAYLVARDARKNCLCPTEVWVVADATTFFTATFAAPPQSDTTMDVWVPSLGYFPKVPVTSGPAPTPNTSHVPPGGPHPTAFTETPATTASPVRAKVVDIDAPVANLDLSVKQEKDKVVLAADVLFAFDKATLTAKARSRIGAAASILRKKGVHGKVQVNGYTDAKGSKAYNKGLSRRRAAAVRKVLAPKLKGTGIRLVPHGYGEADPVAPNVVDGHDNPKGRKLNRRVEIVYHK